MNDNVENMILTQLREMREDIASLHSETKAQTVEFKAELQDLRNMIGGQGVILTSIAGYMHQVEQHVEALEGDGE
ncbi:MAG: hypothetical protein AAFY90_01495 [Pseudomonadota bacterium]